MFKSNNIIKWDLVDFKTQDDMIMRKKSKIPVDFGMKSDLNLNRMLNLLHFCPTLN